MPTVGGDSLSDGVVAPTAVLGGRGTKNRVEECAGTTMNGRCQGAAPGRHVDVSVLPDGQVRQFGEAGVDVCRTSTHHPPVVDGARRTVGVVPKRASTKRVSTALRLPADLHVKLPRRASERDVSGNVVVTQVVDHNLRELGLADPLAASEQQERTPR